SLWGGARVGGVLDEPFLIHGKCLRRQYGWIPQIVYDIPDLIDPFSRLPIPPPDWVVGFPGTRHNGGRARARMVRRRGGGGGAAPRQRFFQSVETRLEPDLAIIDCQISDPFPAPGSRVKARGTVENQGVAGSPVDDLGKTGVGVEAVFVRDDGSERVAATGDVEPILPGETTIVT